MFLAVTPELLQIKMWKFALLMKSESGNFRKKVFGRLCLSDCQCQIRCTYAFKYMSRLSFQRLIFSIFMFNFMYRVTCDFSTAELIVHWDYGKSKRCVEDACVIYFFFSNSNFWHFSDFFLRIKFSNRTCPCVYWEMTNGIFCVSQCLYRKTLLGYFVILTS